MTSLLTASEISGFREDLGDHFDTFARNITVFKEPIATPISTTTTTYPGYGEQGSETNYDYTNVSGVFPGVIFYKNDRAEDVIIPENRINFIQGDVRLKVTEAAKNFIESGRTENIEIDGYRYNLAGPPVIQYFFGSNYHVYYLNKTS